MAPIRPSVSSRRRPSLGSSGGSTGRPQLGPRGAEAETPGPIPYVINPEQHVDHIFGNYFFKGAGRVVHHQGVYDNFMVVGPLLDPFAYAAEAIPTDDPDGAAIFPDR